MNWGIWNDGEGSLLDGMVKKGFFTKVTLEQDLNPKGARLHFPDKGERVQRPGGWRRAWTVNSEWPEGHCALCRPSKEKKENSERAHISWFLIN